MKKIRVVVEEWECKKVEYICEVDEDADMEYGIGDIESLGDMSNSGGDAMGFYCKDISKRTIKDSEDFKSDIIAWEVLLPDPDVLDVGEMVNACRSIGLQTFVIENPDDVEKLDQVFKKKGGSNGKAKKH